jgi:two-component system, response regulator YesN
LYRLLIVDDLKKDIEAIKEALDWEQLGIEIVGEARDGGTGVKEALRLKPDIIIADIAMRNTDGLEMVNRILESVPRVKIIFVSCFDDFKFVSRAINNGACGYVLKPILAGELLKAVNKILAICREEKRSLELLEHKQRMEASISILQESFYKNLLYGVIQDEEDILAQSRFLNVGMDDKQYCVSYIELESEEEEKSFFHGITIVEKLKLNFREEPYIRFILLDLVHIAVVFSDDRQDTGRAKKQYLIKTREILDFVNSSYSLLSTAGMGNVVSSLKDIGGSYKQALKALQYKFYLGRLQVIDTEEVNFQFADSEANLENLSDVVKQILFFGEKMLVEAFINDMLIAPASPSMLKYICYTIINTFQMQLLQMQQNLEDILGSYPAVIEQISAIGSLNDLKDWMIRNILIIIGHIRSSGPKSRELTGKMEDYIRLNYHRQIMLQDVAEHADISPSYANYIYINAHGKTVHQYIEELRMEKAVQLLLEDKELKVFEIAETAGYYNSSYFINVFRKMYSCTPSEYRRKFVL